MKTGNGSKWLQAPNHNNTSTDGFLSPLLLIIYVSCANRDFATEAPPPYRTISVLIVGEGIMDSREIAGQYIKINELYSTYMR